ncbi:response regulator transcription factor [Thalassotalea crassostreae]|uniref:response regulator transcription factor n=1 Tax=Thalassotalea crassostreae TaxID=1763536 RepID=UPI000838B3DB|nr:response regulator transcription factor [Thalassotalea crassostreae]
MAKHILIIEDDKNLRQTLADNLELDGYIVDQIELVAQAKQWLSSNSVDLVILDIMLPDGNGYELGQWITSNTDALILMLTARSLDNDVIEGFVAGADDYVTKPYRSQELLLRIKALLRRQKRIDCQQKVDINGYLVDFDLREIRQNDRQIHLTKTAFDILHFLHTNLNKSCGREEILQKVWGNVYIDNRTVDNFISNLKRQLNLTDKQRFQIKTIRGIGYSLVSKE